MENEQKQYELICILGPHLERTDLDIFKNDLEKMVNNNKGQVIRILEPEKRELAYPINKQGQGIYIVAQIAFESGNVNDFLRELKTNKSILRHLITVLEIPEQSSQEKPRTIRKPRIKKEIKDESKPSLVRTAEGKSDKFNLEEIDKKLDELVGL